MLEIQKVPNQNKNYKKNKKRFYLAMEECHASYVLQHVPMILQKILEPLPCKSLNTCARVCKEWNEFSTTIKKKRTKTEWFLGKCSEEGDGNFIAEQIKTFMEELHAEPENLIMFCTTKLYERQLRVPSRHPAKRPRNAKCDVVDVRELIIKLKPAGCRFLALCADGVVGTSQNTKQITELEDTEALTLLAMPKSDDLEIYTFCVDTYGRRMDEGGTGLFDVSQVTTVPEGKEVKAILFFCGEPFYPPEIGYTLLQYYKGCLIAGGNVDNIISHDECDIPDTTQAEEASLLCIALCGPKVHVGSVIIREEVNTPEEVEKVMKKLKDCNLPEGKSFAFMFACIGRGKAHFNGKDNVESSVFKKLFPNTPLFGFFGNGEVGFDHLPKYNKNSETMEKPVLSTLNKPPPKLYHSYTTIICLISIT